MKESNNLFAFASVVCVFLKGSKRLSVGLTRTNNNIMIIISNIIPLTQRPQPLNWKWPKPTTEETKYIHSILLLRLHYTNFTRLFVEREKRGNKERKGENFQPKKRKKQRQKGWESIEREIVTAKGTTPTPRTPLSVHDCSFPQFPAFHSLSHITTNSYISREIVMLVTIFCDYLVLTLYSAIFCMLVSFFRHVSSQQQCIT